MLGWEFPPHISGGLGTACHGLTHGLARIGVDVTFVVPRAFGDEDKGAVRILGLNEVALEVPAPAPEVEAVPPVPEPEPAGVPDVAPRAAVEARPARVPERRVLAIDSALLPYLTSETYAARVAALDAPVPARPDEPAPPAHAPAAPPAPVGDAARRVEVARGAAGLSGVYGPDLLAEVRRYAEVVAQVARTETFDVIHAHDWMTYPAGIAAKLVSGRPLVAHVHACEHDRSGPTPNPAILAIEQEGLRAADRVICVSHYTEGIVRSRYGTDAAKIRVVHNAVTRREQVEGWHVAKAIEEPVVLFLGRVTYQKGPVYFLEAAARVVRALPGVRFVMSGSGDMLPRMVERAASMGLARHVRFTGFLSGAEVERMYALADLYVMPSVSEPFGISPLEAMALDVPVIVSRQSGVAEILRSALKVDYWDVEDLANKILAVIKRPALRVALTSEGREELKGMRWEVRARLVLDVYDEVAA